MTDAAFFWPKLESLERCVNTIDYFTDEANRKGVEDYTPEERETLLKEVREAQRATEEMVKRLTMPGNYPRGTRVVRFIRKKNGVVIRPDGSQVCPGCDALIAPGDVQMQMHWAMDRKCRKYQKKSR